LRYALLATLRLSHHGASVFAQPFHLVARCLTNGLGLATGKENEQKRHQGRAKEQQDHCKGFHRAPSLS